MIISAAAYEFKSSFLKPLRHCLCILLNLLLIYLKLGCQRLFKCHCFCGDYMHKGSPLNSGEKIFIQSLGKFLLTHYHSAPWSTECLMCCCCYKFCIWEWSRVKPCCHQPCWMGNICHYYCPNFICNFSESFVVNKPWICTCTYDNQLWLMLSCQFQNLIIINCLRIFIHTVGDNLIHLSCKIDWMPV